jgi:hypothetical protein
MSLRPGGLSAMGERLLREFSERFVSPAMKRIGPPAGGKYDLSQLLEIWKDFTTGRDWEELDDRGNAQPPRDADDMEGWIEYYVSPKLTAKQVHAGKYCDKAAVLEGVERFNLPFLRQECLRYWPSSLSRQLSLFCLDWGKPLDSKYCADLESVLIEFMDWHAMEFRKQLAEIETVQKIFRELEFARTEKVPVPIIGDSRFGKTRAVEVHCDMWPGRERLVTVPESNHMRDFLEAHADPLGIAYGPNTTERQLKRDVRYVIRQFGLFIAYDEAHYLIPVRYNKGTPPSRLNWVRSAIIDKGEPCCALFATPQSYKQTLAEYAKETGYNLEQWLGRIVPALVLPPELGPDDVMAVAKHNFTELDKPFLKLIAARAMQSEGYLKNVEFTVKRARFLARERGDQPMTQTDVEQAIAWAAGSEKAITEFVGPRSHHGSRFGSSRWQSADERPARAKAHCGQFAGATRPRRGIGAGARRGARFR